MEAFPEINQVIKSDVFKSGQANMDVNKVQIL